MGGIVVHFGIDEHRLADGAVANGLPHRADRIAVEIARRAGEHQSAGLREPEQGAGLVKVGGQRLFGIDVLAGFQGVSDRLVVRPDARQVDDDFDSPIGEQRVIARVDVEAVVARHRRRARGVDIEDAANLELGMRPSRAHVDVEHDTRIPTKAIFIFL